MKHIKSLHLYARCRVLTPRKPRARLVLNVFANVRFVLRAPASADDFVMHASTTKTFIHTIHFITVPSSGDSRFIPLRVACTF